MDLMKGPQKIGAVQGPVCPEFHEILQQEHDQDLEGRVPAGDVINLEAVDAEEPEEFHEQQFEYRTDPHEAKDGNENIVEENVKYIEPESFTVQCAVLALLWQDHLHEKAEQERDQHTIVKIVEGRMLELVGGVGINAFGGGNKGFFYLVEEAHGCFTKVR